MSRTTKGPSPRSSASNGVYVGSHANRVVEFLKVAFLLVCCAIVLGPFLMVVSTSLADSDQIGREGGLVIWPERPSFEAYRLILAGGRVTQALGVSAFVTIVGTAIALLVTALLAYALSRPTAFSKPLLMFVVVTMFFSVGIIPAYLTVRQFGLLDSVWSLIIPTSVSAFNVVVMRAFFQNIPSEITEAALVDGASEWRVFWSIVLPLSKPIMAAIGLFYAVTYWNTFFTALLYINDENKWPIQLVLRQYLVNNERLSVDEAALAGAVPPAQPALQMAVLVLSLIPIVCVYPFIQRHFAKGMLTGAIKG